MPTVRIAILVFEKLTALDAIGPYEVLRSVPGWEVQFVGPVKGPIRTDSGALGLNADFALDEVSEADIVLVPGGEGNRPLLRDETVLSWLRAIDAGSKWTTSVCTGSLVLAAAGLLDGLRATTHWSVLADLEPLGASPTSERVVEHLDQRIITAAGVSSGIDMALRLSELLVDDVAAQAMQLMVEYDPQPPFDAGALAKASPEVIERVIEYVALLPEGGAVEV